MPYNEYFVNHVVDFYKRTIESLKNVSLSKNDENISHQLIVPSASYSPWIDDHRFMELYQSIKENTLVDIYRCYELYSFITRHKQLLGDVLEVGVWKGGTGCLLSKALNTVTDTNNTYLIDTFRGVVKAGKMDTLYKGGEHSDTSEYIVIDLFKKCNVKNFHILKGIFPDEVELPSSVNELRLCHIDVDTYESALQIFNKIWPMIVPGGAVMFDDYGFWGCEGVTKLCNEIPVTNAAFIHNLNGHAVFIKTCQ